MGQGTGDGDAGRDVPAREEGGGAREEALIRQGEAHRSSQSSQFFGCPFGTANGFQKIDENHHQAVIVYPSEEVANAERSKLEETRSRSSQDNNNIMVEEFVGPIVMQLTSL